MKKILSSKGKTKYCVVVCFDDSAAQTAAEEIRSFLKICGGADLKISEDGRGFKNRIYLCRPEIIPGRPICESESLGRDGFIIRTVREDVFIAGKTGRAVLYGAYAFIEKVMKVRFLTADETYAPEQDEIVFGRLRIKQIPAFENRCYLSYEGLENVKFMSRTGTNNEYRLIPAEYGGKLGWFMGLDGEDFHPTHNTLYYVKPSEYFSSYPEWYYTGGKDFPRELCYSGVGLTEDGNLDPELEDSPVLAAARTLKRYIMNSDDLYFMIGQMDIADYCKCDKCLAEEKKYGRSGMNIRFVNAVARETVKLLEKENVKDREFYVITFAYAWSQEPPFDENGGIGDGSVIPDKNVIVRLAPISAENYFGLTEKGQSEDIIRQMKGWQKVLKSCMSWTYHACFGSYFVYYPTIRHWKRDFAFLKKMGDKFIMMQGAYNEKNIWTEKLDYYAASRLMRNTRLNPYRLRREFIKLYYGEAAKYIEKFIRNFDKKYAVMFGKNFLKNDKWRPRSNISVAWTRLVYPRAYTTKFWEKQLNILDEAERAVKESVTAAEEREKALLKIEAVRLTPLFMILTGYDKYYPSDKEGKAAMKGKFFAAAEKLGVKHYREGAKSSLKDFADVLENKTQNTWGIFYEDRQ